MKKLLKIFCAGALMSALCAGLAACNEPKDPEQNDEGTEIQPVPVDKVSAEVAAFFSFDFIHDIWEDKALLPSESSEFCVMINSVDELPKVDDNGIPLEVPSIDLDSYTLVIGGAYVGNTGWSVTQQSIVVGSNNIKMYINVKESPGGGLDVPSIIPFWGLYPKLPNLPISVERK